MLPKEVPALFTVIVYFKQGRLLGQNELDMPVSLLHHPNPIAYHWNTQLPKRSQRCIRIVPVALSARLAHRWRGPRPSVASEYQSLEIAHHDGRSTCL